MTIRVGTTEEEWAKLAESRLARIQELEEELDEARERIEELEHELETETRDNDGYTVVDGVYEEI